MTNEEKLTMCIIPSVELRQVNCMIGGQPSMIKVQQKHYNYSGTEMVWRDIDNVYVDYKDFSKKVSFE